MVKDVVKPVFPTFPETVFAVQDGEGDDTYPIADADAGSLAERGVAVPAAEYRLVRVGVVVEKTSFEPKV